MTERINSYSQNPEFPPLPEGFTTPSDSVIFADIIRGYYESLFVHKTIRTPDMPEEFYTPLQKEVMMKLNFAQIKMILTSPGYDPQAICDALDFETLAREEEELRRQDPEEEAVSVQAYQIENGVRTTINALSEVAMPYFPKLRKIYVKKYIESGKLAREEQVPEEDVYTDQGLYFKLVKKSTSPEDFISQNKEMMEILKEIMHVLVRDDFRADLLIRFAERTDVSVDEIEKKVAHTMDTPKAREETHEAYLTIDDYMRAYTNALIERYWGRETAQLFN